MGTPSSSRAARPVVGVLVGLLILAAAGTVAYFLLIAGILVQFAANQKPDGGAGGLWYFVGTAACGLGGIALACWAGLRVARSSDSDSTADGSRD